MQSFRGQRAITLLLALILTGSGALALDGLDALLKQAEADIEAGDAHGAAINLDAIIAQTADLKPVDPHLPAALMFKASVAVIYQHFEEADGLIQRALDTFAKLPATHKVVENESRCHAILASLKEATGKNEEAEAAYLKSIELLQSIGDTDDQGPLYNALGSFYFKCLRYGDSEKAHRKAMDILVIVEGKNSDNYICATNNLATALEHQKKYDESAKLSLEALSLAETKYGGKSDQLLPILDNLATVYEHKKQPGLAEEAASRSLALAEQLTGHDSPSLWEYVSSLGLLYLDNGKYKLAEEHILRAVKLLEQLKGDNRDALSVLYYRLANCYEGTHEDEQAEAYYQKAIASTSMPKAKKLYDDGLSNLLKKSHAD
jgi:Tfp pilus assembly protein PilF